MASNVTDSLESKLLQTATAYQQNYYEVCSDWNRYESNELGYLRDYIGYALFGPPGLKDDNENDEEKDKITRNNEVKSICDSSCFDYNDSQKKSISLIYDKVIEHGSCEKSEGVILCAVIYNVIFNKDGSLEASSKKSSESKDDASKDKENKNGVEKEMECPKREVQVYPVPVFKVKKYHGTKDKIEKRNTNKSHTNVNDEEIRYIDNSGRIYKGFNAYMEECTLPQCTMVLPKNGRYQIDPLLCSSTILAKEDIDLFITTVWLEIRGSPAGKIAAKVAQGGDMVSMAVNVASLGVGVAAMLTPVGPGILLASAVGAGVSGLWTVGRSTQQLVDRNQHGESINVTDKAALGAWIGIAGGTMGVAATGSSVLLSRAIRAGSTIGKGAMVVHDTVLIGNLIVNGVGVGFKSYDMYESFKRDGTVTAQDVFFLSAHLFFFCNSVVNVRFARSIIETSQGQMLKDYEASLRSNRHRKEFQRMARNTRAAGNSDISSNEEIIRGINKIGNKDEFFAAMVRNRKAFSAAGAKASFSDGKVTVNSMMTIDPIEFANLPKDVRFDIIKNVSSAEPNKVSGIATNHMNETSYKNYTANNTAILKEFCMKHSNAMIQAAPPKIVDFANVLNELCKVQNSAGIFIKLLEIGYKILQAMPRDKVLTLGDVLASIVDFLWQYLKMNFRRLKLGILIDDPAAVCVLEKLIQELWIRVEAEIDDWVKGFEQWVKDNIGTPINTPFFKNSHN